MLNKRNSTSIYYKNLYHSVRVPFILGFLLFLIILTVKEENIVSNEDRRNYEIYLKEHPFNNRPRMSKKDWKKKFAKKDRPDLAAEQNFLMTVDPQTRNVPRERLIQAFDRADITKTFRSVNIEWDEHGPNNVAGRTRAVMFDPNDSEGKKFWAGGVTGGLWYTDDITLTDPSWNKINDFWDNVSISCIAYDPTNTQTFYVGTGEIYTNDVRGFGIWKTTDGGTTWSRLTSTDEFYWVNDIVVRNENGTGVVYAATGMRYYEGAWHYGERGMLRSTDGGYTWSQVWSGSGSTLYQPSDLEIDSENNIWAGTRNNAWGNGGGKILKSGDGISWSTVYTTNNANRMELVCAPSNVNVIYAVGAGGSGDNDIGIFIKSVDGGNTWSNVSIPLNWDNVHFTRGQAWYDLILAVAPDNENIIYAGGIDIHKSTDSGSNWTMLSAWHNYYANIYSLEYVHADQHSFAFRPGYPNTVVFGNDGGIHMTINAGNTFIEKNSGYNVTQFYSTASHPTAGNYYFLAGSQDNGTQQFIDATGIVSTNEVTGGDGAYCFIDQTDPLFQITSYIYNNYRISTNGGNSFTYLDSDNSGRFINPADYDDDADILYSAVNSDTIKRVVDVSSSYYSDYVAISLGATASHIRVSDYSTNVIYIGTSSGRIFKVNNANSSNPSSVEITGNSFPTAWISCIELGSTDNEIMVTFSNFGVTSIWHTDNGGSSWIGREGDLPDMPVRWALFNPENRSEVILATDIGVWSTNNFSSSSPSWVASNSGLANVRVDMFQIRDSDGLVTAATYGRGLFSTDDFYSNAPPRIVQVQGLDIGGDEDLQHMISHSPMITFEYYDNMDEAQTGYQVQVSTDSLFSSADMWNSGIVTVSDTSFPYAGNTLIDGTTYYLRVKAGSGTFYSDWSSISFRMNTEPTAPIPVSPVNNDVMDMPVMLHIINGSDPESDVLTYSFNVYDDDALSNKLDSITNITEGTNTGWEITETLPDNGQYFWTVFANDGYEESAVSDAASFFLNIVNDQPAEFSLTYPADSGEVTTTFPTLLWQKSVDPDPEDTVRYMVRFGSTISNLESFYTDTITTYQFTTQLEDNTDYIWKVIAEDRDGLSIENTGGYHSFRVNTENDLPEAFSLISPEHESVVTNSTPTLYWEVPVDPDDRSRSIVFYHVYLDTNLTGSVPDTVNTNSYTASSLMEDVIYYWKIVAVDNDGGVKESSTWSFFMNSDNSLPLDFSLLEPVNGAVLNIFNPSFCWEESTDPDINDEVNYTIMLGENIDSLNVIYNGPFMQSCFYETMGLVEDNKVYFWKVKAYDISGNSIENTGGYYSFIINTQNDAPVASTLLEPINESIQTDLTPGFFWAESYDPDPMDHISYTMHWWPVGMLPVIYSADTDTNSFTPVDDLSDNSRFAWMVTAKDIQGSQSNSDSSYFYTDEFPEAPSNFSTIIPENNAEGIAPEVEFVWNQATDPDPVEEIRYQLVYSTDWQDSSTYNYSDLLEDTSIIVTLDDNIEYYWLVVAKDSDGFSIGSNDDNPNRMVVGTLSLDDAMMPETFALYQNYPNPFNPITTIRYDLPNDEMVTITIYNLMGRVIKSLVNSEQRAGFRSVRWNATNNFGDLVSAGMYIYTIQAGEFKQTKKMVLLK